MARALLQKLAGVLMVPIVLLPVAAVLQAAGFILGYEPLAAGGRAILVHFLPLFFASAAGVGFGGGDAMAALAAVTCYVVTWGVGSAVARDPALNPGALGGLLAGAAGVWLYGRCAPVSPVVITNRDRVAGTVPLTAGPVRAGETPLLQVTLR